MRGVAGRDGRGEERESVAVEKDPHEAEQGDEREEPFESGRRHETPDVVARESHAEHRRLISHSRDLRPRDAEQARLGAREVLARRVTVRGRVSVKVVRKRSERRETKERRSDEDHAEREE